MDRRHRLELAQWVMITLLSGTLGVLIIVRSEIPILTAFSGSLGFLWVLSRTRTIPQWPRIWKLMGFAFPKRIRNDIYDPAVSELLEDYVSRKQFRTKAARRWLTICFTFRTVLLVLDCIRCIALSKPMQFLLRIHHWWTSM